MLYINFGFKKLQIKMKNNIIFDRISNNETIVFHSHQGFGDLICCSSIANFLFEKFPNKKIIYPVKGESYKKNLKRFCNPKIEILVFEDHAGVDIINSFVNKNDYSLIRTGFDKYFYNSFDPWDYSFYKSIGVDYEIKTSHFFIEKNDKKEKEILEKFHLLNGEKFAFVHDDPNRNLEFKPNTKLKIVKNLFEFEIADFAGILNSASELHLMGSSMLCLADMMHLPNKEQDAYYYTFRGELNMRGIENWNKVIL